MHTQSFLEDTSFIRKLLAFNNLIISSFCEFKIPLKITSPSILRQLRMSGIMPFITSARILHKIKSKFFKVYFETNPSNDPRYVFKLSRLPKFSRKLDSVEFIAR